MPNEIQIPPLQYPVKPIAGKFTTIKVLVHIVLQQNRIGILNRPLTYVNHVHIILETWNT